MNRLTVYGKGVYIWKPENIYGGDAKKIADALEAAGVSHVCIKLHNGTFVYPDRLGVINEIRSRGIVVGGWGYLYLRWSPSAEAEATVAACALYKPAYYLADAEGYASYAFAGAATFASKLRTALPDMPIGLNSYWKPSYHRDFPFVELREKMDFDCPQVYWRGYDPVGKLRQSKEEYAAMSPQRPFAMAAGEMYFENGVKPTPEQVVAFLSTAREDEDIQAVVMWSMDQNETTPELWEAFAGFDWGKGEVAEPDEEDIIDDLLGYLNLLPEVIRVDQENALKVYHQVQSFGVPVLYGMTNQDLAVLSGICEISGLQVTEPRQPLYEASVTAYALSIRPDPSTTYAALGYLRYGDEVEVWEESGQGKWARIDMEESRWVSTGYLKVGG
jgi:hypothetical protein